MLTVDYQNLVTFKELELGVSFIFKYEIDWLNYLIEHEIPVTNDPRLTFIRAYYKTSDSEYNSTDWLIADYRKFKNKLKQVSGTCYENTEVYLLVDEK